MIRDLNKRLRKLESRLPREESEEEKFTRALVPLLATAFGHYLGDLKPNEPLEAGYGRALGYEHVREVLDALRHNQPDFEDRWARAKHELFMKFGVDLSTADNGEFKEALKRMHAGLPESRKARLPIPS
jgi:hypothetical protein